VQDPTLRLLAELVRIDSVNPSLCAGGAGESAIADFVGDRLRRAGLDVERTEGTPGRPSVVATLRGPRRGSCLMLCGHLDTVGVEGMSEPWTPLERDGRLYGRGAQDMKGGLASIISAAESLAHRGLPAGALVVAAVADEEHASLGASEVASRWTADAAIVTEPTDMLIGVAHQGFSWIDVQTSGRAAHGSRPDEGEDAILRMGRVLARLEELQTDLQERPPHPLLGHGSLHASTVAGGRELSTYPDHCELRWERRTLPGESPETALLEAQEILDSLRAQDPAFRATAQLLFSQPPYATRDGAVVVEDLESSLEALGRERRRAGMTFWTDAAILGAAGIPSVVFGPGGEGLHGLEEYVRMAEVLLCRDVLIETARRFCSREVSRPEGTGSLPE
jgi:acetylornithine deacetylase